MAGDQVVQKIDQVTRGRFPVAATEQELLATVKGVNDVQTVLTFFIGSPVRCQDVEIDFHLTDEETGRPSCTRFAIPEQTLVKGGRKLGLETATAQAATDRVHRDGQAENGLERRLDAPYRPEVSVGVGSRQRTVEQESAGILNVPDITGRLAASVLAFKLTAPDSLDQTEGRGLWDAELLHEKVGVSAMLDGLNYLLVNHLESATLSFFCGEILRRKNMDFIFTIFEQNARWGGFVLYEPEFPATKNIKPLNRPVVGYRL